MNRLLLSAVLSVFAICLLSCSGDIVRIPEEFLKQEDALPWFSRNCICDINGQEAVLFATNDGFAIMNIETKKIDTIYDGQHAGITELCYNSDDGTIWAQVSNSTHNIWCSKIGKEISCPPTKHYGETVDWFGSETNDPFFSFGHILYTGINPSLDSDVDYADFRAKSGLIAAWDVGNPDSVKCVKIFGNRPSDQPKGMFIDDCYQVAFNEEDSIIVAGTELSQKVVVMTMSGEQIEEKTLSSKYYVKPQKRDFSQNHSATEKIKYWEENMLFRGLFYDKYRKLYYRILDMGKRRDKTSFTKKKSDWVLIIADTKLNKKYEVKFDGDKYSSGLRIGKQGVYIRTADNPKNKTMDLFVFE